MAAARGTQAKRRTPGYEPARGFPDPNFERQPEPAPAPGVVTHYPHRNGAACGISPVPTSASAYSPTKPTCGWCKNYLTQVQQVTAAQYGTRARAVDTEPPAPEEQETPAPETPRDKPSK